jgi:hypothetical protein
MFSEDVMTPCSEGKSSSRTAAVEQQRDHQRKKQLKKSRDIQIN